MPLVIFPNLNHTKPRDWLGESLRKTCLCRVGCKPLTQSINQPVSLVHKGSLLDQVKEEKSRVHLENSHYGAAGVMMLSVFAIA